MPAKQCDRVTGFGSIPMSSAIKNLKMFKKLLLLIFIFISFSSTGSNSLNFVAKSSLSTGTEYSMIGGGIGVIKENFYIGIDSRYRLKYITWYPWGLDRQYQWYGLSNTVEIGWFFKNLVLYIEGGCVKLEKIHSFNRRESVEYFNWGGGVGLKYDKILLEIHHTTVEELIFKLGFLF